MRIFSSHKVENKSRDIISNGWKISAIYEKAAFVIPLHHAL